ncbi:MAG: cytochrome b/b6 domain-containing protein [Ramlibacter sp.]|nr:cytochrome b/b6 domain-containing protein [Ramlibacter sp.]
MIESRGRAQHVWDPFVRVFHWALVSCVFLNQILLEGGETPHRWTGYAALVLISGRLVWGFVGSAHARFASFAPTPARVRAQVCALLRGRVPAYVGHSPLGALMMLALVLLVIALAVTGWLQTTDAFWGDESLQKAHETLANVLLLAAGMHGVAAIVIGRLERVRLIKAMITGVKQSY